MIFLLRMFVYLVPISLIGFMKYMPSFLQKKKNNVFLNGRTGSIHAAQQLGFT